jgi:hypothetical protein
VVNDHQEFKAHLLGAWKREGDGRRGVPTAAEAVAVGRSSVRGFPARRRAKLWLGSCRRMRESYWSSRIRWRRVGGKGSTADRNSPVKR